MIKIYLCSICDKESTIEDWNKRSMRKFGSENFGKIETEKDECIYICPKCGNEVNGNTIEWI